MPPPEGSDEVVGGEADGQEFGPDRGDLIAESILAGLTTYGERVGTALVDSSTYLAVIAMVEVAIVMVLLSLPPSPAPIVIALITFAVYTNDHLADDPSESPRAAFVARHRDVLDLLAAVAYGLAVAISALGGPVTLFLTLLPGMFWIAYASGQIPLLGVNIRRLKRTLVVNSTIVALAWAISLTFLPLAFASRPLSISVAVVFGYFFLRSLVDTIIPNIRDQPADRAANVSTIPVRFGLRTTRFVLYGLDGMSAILILSATLLGFISLSLAIALLLGMVYSLVLTTLLGRGPSPATVALAAEFEYIVVGLALIPVVYAW